MCVDGVQLDSFFCGTSCAVSTPPCRAWEKTESVEKNPMKKNGRRSDRILQPLKIAY